MYLFHQSEKDCLLSFNGCGVWIKVDLTPNQGVTRVGGAAEKIAKKSEVLIVEVWSMAQWIVIQLRSISPSKAAFIVTKAVVSVQTHNSAQSHVH